MSVSGNRVLIAATFDSSIVTRGGQAFLFDAVSGGLLHTLNDPTPGVNNVFGVTVAIDGDKLVIADGSDNTNAGAAGQAHIFNAVTGGLLHTLNDPHPGAGDRFGVSVAISGAGVVVDCSRDRSVAFEAGKAFLFDANTGNLLRTFNDPTPTFGGRFGAQVAISGEDVLIGASQDYSVGGGGSDSFLFDAATGALRQQISDPTTFHSSGSNTSLAINGNRMLIGRPGDANGPTGIARLYLAVPEPASGALLGMALMLIGLARVGPC